MTNTRTFWGCPRCNQEFAGEVSPYHEIELGDFFSSATWKRACTGNGKPLIQYERDLETQYVSKVYAKK